MSELKVKDRTIVTPGELLAEGMDFLPSAGTYRDGEGLYANKLGLCRVDGKVLKVVALTGEYIPKKDDTIIVQIKDIFMSGWNTDTFSPYTAVLNVKDGVSGFVGRGVSLKKFYDIGDYLVVKIFNVTSQNLVDITMRGPGLRKLTPGRIIKVNTNKVPRIIGKQGSMVSMIKENTNTQITVGQNGIIWISGEPKDELKAEQAIRKIEAEAHHEGLTDTMQKWLEAQK